MTCRSECVTRVQLMMFELRPDFSAMFRIFFNERSRTLPYYRRLVFLTPAIRQDADDEK